MNVSISCLIGLLAAIVDWILVNLSYFELNTVVIDSTNSLNRLVKELRSFGEFGDGKQVEKFIKRTWGQAWRAYSAPELGLSQPRPGTARHSAPESSLSQLRLEQRATSMPNPTFFILFS